MLSYTAETISSPDGIPCRVLDEKAVDFSQPAEGRKSAQTLIRRAEGGEVIETKNSQGLTESTYIAQPGDAIFVNLNNMSDVYVPGEKDGTRWKFSELTQRGYEIVGDDRENGGVRVKSLQTAKVLVEVVEEPTCIKDAWGPDQHQFLYQDATLKLNPNGRVTGIDKEAFDKTWEITKPAANSVSTGSKPADPEVP